MDVIRMTGKMTWSDSDKNQATGECHKPCRPLSTIKPTIPTNTHDFPRCNESVMASRQVHCTKSRITPMPVVLPNVNVRCRHNSMASTKSTDDAIGEYLTP